MAIRKRAGRAKPYQVYWNNPFTDKRETQSFETEEEALKADSLIKHRLKFERESFRPNNEPEATQDVLTLEAVYIMYRKEKQFSKKSLRWQLDSMRLPLQQFGNLPIDAIKSEHLKTLVEELKMADVKNVTINGKMSVLKTVLNWAAANGFCLPVAFPKMLKGTYEKFIPPTPTELSAIIQVAPPHIARVVLIGSQCGVRVGPCEMFQLKWKDVDFELSLLRVHGSHKNYNAPWREVPIRSMLLNYMKRWKIGDTTAGIDYLIHFRGKPVNSISQAWQTALHAAGITRRIRPYDLRHSFATELIAAGTDIGTVAKLMGHSGPAMLLKHYQYVMDKQKRAAVENLPNLLNVPKNMCPEDMRQ